MRLYRDDYLYLYFIAFERFVMLKTYIIMLVICIGFVGGLYASEQMQQQKKTHQQNENAKKTPGSNAIQTLHPIKQVHGPVIKIYEDGTRETDFNDGTGAVLVEHCQGFYYYLHANDNRLLKK